MALIEKLKKYFKPRQEVAFAFLFGSQSTGKANKLSDIDIAVYFYPKQHYPLKYEEEVFYEYEDKIWGDLEKLLNNEVELLVLNRVSASVAASAIRGIPLLINDWGLYLDFMLIITSVAIDFRDMLIRDFLERQKG
ncbi:MAG: nucleotidyltransferase domain-containing protein [Nitrospirota bacterium]